MDTCKFVNKAFKKYLHKEILYSLVKLFNKLCLSVGVLIKMVKEGRLRGKECLYRGLFGGTIGFVSQAVAQSVTHHWWVEEGEPKVVVGLGNPACQAGPLAGG